MDIGLLVLRAVVGLLTQLTWRRAAAASVEREGAAMA